MVLRIERKTSKIEEMRLEMEEVMDDIIVAVFGSFGWSFQVTGFDFGGGEA